MRERDSGEMERRIDFHGRTLTSPSLFSPTIPSSLLPSLLSSPLFLDTSPQLLAYYIIFLECLFGPGNGREPGERVGGKGRRRRQKRREERRGGTGGLRRKRRGYREELWGHNREKKEREEKVREQ